MREYCCAGIVGPVMKNAAEVVDSSPWDDQIESPRLKALGGAPYRLSAAL